MDPPVSSNEDVHEQIYNKSTLIDFLLENSASKVGELHEAYMSLADLYNKVDDPVNAELAVKKANACIPSRPSTSISFSDAVNSRPSSTRPGTSQRTASPSRGRDRDMSMSEQDKKHSALLKVAQEQVSAIGEDMKMTCSQPRESLETVLVKECTLIREQVTKMLEQQMVKATTVEDESDLASLALTGTTVRVGEEGDTFNFWYDDTLNKVEAILSENKFESKNKVLRQLDMEKEKWMTAAQHHLNSLTEQGQDDQANLQVDLLVDAFHAAESSMYQWQVEVTAEVNKISESILEDWKYQAKDQKDVEEDVLRQQHRSTAMDVPQKRIGSADSSATGRSLSPPNNRGRVAPSNDVPGELSADINRLQQAFSNAIPEMTSRNEVEVKRLQKRVDDWRDRAMHTIETETAAQFNHWKRQIDAQDDDSPEAKIAIITAIEQERAAWKMRILEQAQKMEERGRAPSRGSSRGGGSRSGSRGGSRSGSRDVQTRPRSSMSPSSRAGEGSILEEGEEDEDNEEGAMEWQKKTLKEKLREEERALKIMTSPPQADSEDLERSMEDIGDEDSVVWSIQRDEASLLNKPTSPVAARPPARGMTREEAESTYKALEDKYASPSKQTTNNLEASALTVEEEMIALQLQRQKEIDAQIQKQKRYWEDKQKQKDMERRRQQLVIEQREKERELAEQEEFARMRKEAELAEVKAMEEAWTMMQERMNAEKTAIKESVEEAEVKLAVKHKDSKKNKVKVKKRNQQKKIDHYQAEVERNHLKEMKRMGIMTEDGKLISAQKHDAEIHEKEKYILGVPIAFTSRDREEAYKHFMELSENVEPEKEYNRTVLGTKLEDVSTVMDEPIDPAYPPANDNILLRAPVNVDVEKGRYGVNTGFKTGVDSVWKYSKKGRQQPITVTPKETSEITHVITMRDTGPLKAMLQERRDARASEIEFIYSQEQPKLILGQKHTSGHSSRHGSPQSRSRPRSRSRSPRSRSRSPRSRNRSPPKTPNTQSRKNLLSTDSIIDTDPLMITDGSVAGGLGFPQEGSYVRGQTPAGSVSFADFSHEGFAQDDISQSLGAGMSIVSQLSGNNSSKAGSQSASRTSSRQSRKPNLEYNRPISSTGSTRLHTREGKYLLDNKLPPEPGFTSPNADLYGDGALSPSAFPHIPQQDGAVGRIGVDIPEEYLEEQTAISMANSVVGFGQGGIDEEGSVMMMIGNGDLAEGSMISQVTMDPGMMPNIVGTGSGFPGANDGMGEMQLIPAQGGSVVSDGSMMKIENGNKLASIQSPMQQAMITTFGNKRVNDKKKKKTFKKYRYPCEFPGCHATFNQSWELYNHHNAIHETEIRSSNYRQKIRIPQEQVIHRYEVVAYDKIDHSTEQEYLQAIEAGQMTSDDLHEVQVRMKLKQDQLRSTLPTLKKSGGGGHGNSNREFDQRLMNPTLGHYSFDHDNTTGGALTKYNASQSSMNSSNKSLFRNTSHLSNTLSIDDSGRVVDRMGDAKREKKRAAQNKRMNRSKMASFGVDVVRQSNKWEEKMQFQRWSNHTAHLKQWRKEITTLMRRQAKALPQGKLNRRAAENIVPKM